MAVKEGLDFDCIPIYYAVVLSRNNIHDKGIDFLFKSMPFLD